MIYQFAKDGLIFAAIDKNLRQFLLEKERTFSVIEDYDWFTTSS